MNARGAWRVRILRRTAGWRAWRALHRFIAEHSWPRTKKLPVPNGVRSVMSVAWYDEPVLP